MINKMIATALPFLPEWVVWQFSRTYIAGKRVEEAMSACRSLNADGVKTTIDILGEFIRRLADAEANRDEYLDLIETAQAMAIDGNYSLKPTMFGLLLDEAACYRHVRAIVAKAAKAGNFIRIDMEDSACVDLEIDLFRRLHTEFPGHVGLVLQAYLHRTMDDLTAMLDLHTPANPLNYRLCKGIYAEPASIAYQRHDEINAHYLEDLEFMLKKRHLSGHRHPRPSACGRGFGTARALPGAQRPLRISNALWRHP